MVNFIIHFGHGVTFNSFKLYFSSIFLTTYNGNPSFIIIAELPNPKLLFENESEILSFIWNRSIQLSDITPNEFLLNLRRSKARLIYDIDDNLIHMYDHSKEEIFKDKIEIVKLFLRFSDEVWVSTYKLKTAFSLYSSNIKIVENSSFTKPNVCRGFKKKQPLHIYISL